MSEETVVRQAAPTLAGVKTGSLFPYRCESAEDLRADIRAFNRTLVPRGMCLLVLRMMERSALLYLYRPAELERDLKDSTAREVLEEAGYRCDSCAACVRELVERFRREGEFPHEIGLFLSYPPEDVRGFIENHARNYKLAGPWKVYGDVAQARQTFEKYRKCTDSYCRSLRAGFSLAQLAVAIELNDERKQKYE